MALAKDGASTPLLGGRIGLMWGFLLALVFFGQWAILTKTLNIPPNNIGFLWLAFAIIGSIGSAVMGHKIDQKPGANSVANRIETYVWIMFSGYMARLWGCRKTNGFKMDTCRFICKLRSLCFMLLYVGWI